MPDESFQYSELGSGLDFFYVVQSFADSAVGSDTLLNAITREIGVGLDEITVSVSIDVEDSAVGTDDMASDFQRVIAESAVGYEFYQVYAGPIEDSGTGTDAYTVILSLIDQQQTIVIAGSSGSYKLSLTFGGITYTTNEIDHNDTTATVEAKIEALPCVGAGNVSVSGTQGSLYTVDWIGDLLAVPVATMVATPVSGVPKVHVYGHSVGAFGAMALDLEAEQDIAFTAVGSTRFYFSGFIQDAVGSMVLTIIQSITDSGAGTDAIDSERASAVNDYAAGTFTLPTISREVFQVGRGAFTLDPIAVTVAVSLSAVGTSTFVPTMNLTDSASGTDDFVPTMNLTFTGSGAQAMTLEVSASVSDSASTSDYLDTARTVTQSATGSQVTAMRYLPPADDGAGSESLSLVCRILVTDSAVSDQSMYPVQATLLIRDTIDLRRNARGQFERNDNYSVFADAGTVEDSATGKEYAIAAMGKLSYPVNTDPGQPQER